MFRPHHACFRTSARSYTLIYWQLISLADALTMCFFQPTLFCSKRTMGLCPERSSMVNGIGTTCRARWTWGPKSVDKVSVVGKWWLSCSSGWLRIHSADAPVRQNCVDSSHTFVEYSPEVLGPYHKSWSPDCTVPEMSTLRTELPHWMRWLLSCGTRDHYQASTPQPPSSTLQVEVTTEKPAE